jgi:hypothetical protein
MFPTMNCFHALLNAASEGWQGVRKVVIAEVEAEREAVEKR